MYRAMRSRRSNQGPLDDEDAAQLARARIAVDGSVTTIDGRDVVPRSAPRPRPRSRRSRPIRVCARCSSPGSVGAAARRRRGRSRHRNRRVPAAPLGLLDRERRQRARRQHDETASARAVDVDGCGAPRRDALDRGGSCRRCSRRQRDHDRHDGAVDDIVADSSTRPRRGSFDALLPGHALDPDHGLAAVVARSRDRR